MAPFPLSMLKNHPYADSAKHSHGHFAPTPYTIRPYSAAAIPFRWMLKEQAEGNLKHGIASRAETLQLGYASDREPDLGFETSWVQEGTNQRVLLDTFFSATKPDQSLIFFYAKRTPLLEDTRRVIVGVGRVKSIGAPTEYRYVDGGRPDGKIDGYLWERNIEHSIRPQGLDGFLLPYQALLALAEKDDSIDLTAVTAFAPDEYFENYSYGSELLPQDGAIASLLALEKAIKAIRAVMEGPWQEYLQWVDRELNRLWQLRGAFPGLGAALCAFGISHGNLLAWHLMADSENLVDPWPLLSATLSDTSRLPTYLREGLGKTLQQKWEKLPDDRRALLKLLARFNLNNDQAKRWYQITERETAGIRISDAEILANPYLIYEQDRLQATPIAFAVIDRGLFQPETLRNAFPVPEPSKIGESIDKRRVRAVMIHTLEEAASAEGHTFLPASWMIQRIRNSLMKPECPLDADTLPIIEDYLPPRISTIILADKSSGFQLDRYVETSKLICESITKRKNGKVNAGEFDWASLVNAAIDGNKEPSKLSDDDFNARREKAAALEIIYRSRVSVLMGAAGTGKSTLLKALCNIPNVKNGGILLLAPTGKARVRLEQTSGMIGQGKTVAQFLNGLYRYDGNTGRYFINPDRPKSSAHKTVVIDECSMLTEEQLAALLDSITGVERFVLVGDPKQLPPIGAGRPYVDIVKLLAPDNIDSLFPKVAASYAELTVTMRQQVKDDIPRVDILLANAFSGRAMDAGADEVWQTVTSGQTPYVKLVRWNQPDQLKNLVLNELMAELEEVKSVNDEVGFEKSLGGTVSEFNGQSNVFFNNRYQDRAGAAEKAEDWQVLSPIRQSQAGVTALNRLIQQQFRSRFIDMANVVGYSRKIPSPVGTDGIIYGDKVINLENKSGRYVFPNKQDSYVANGDIGIVIGHRRTKVRNTFPKNTEVEFSSQIGHSYTYKSYEFDGERGSSPLELAYALTIHKTQGSEFGTTFLIVPNPCRLLSREMLYTALTRHKGKVVILHQGDFRDLQRYSHEQSSEVAKRFTNVFRSSRPVEVRIKNQSVFLDNNLIYRTERGELVRSKSEWIIADKLHAAGIDYQYEQPLQLGGIERFPDFTIVDDDSGNTWYWEHNGMLSNEEYRQRWSRKLDAYRQQGILPLSEGGGENGTLLITEEKAGHGLDADEIKNNIDLIRGK
ncbi:RNA helicase [Methylomonas methanica]|uniref:RNA helicase n=2 Tax=Methylomonas methanica TaxID=421 RepID=A0A177M8Y6_METMH|nr:RNA helicase [Methylomonas methanica]